MLKHVFVVGRQHIAARPVVCERPHLSHSAESYFDACKLVPTAKSLVRFRRPKPLSRSDKQIKQIFGNTSQNGRESGSVSLQSPGCKRRTTLQDEQLLL